MKTLNFIDGELTLDRSGNIPVVTGAEGLRQKIESRLMLWRADWFLDVQAGVPFVEGILGRGQATIANRDVGQLFNSELLKEPEVLSVLSSESLLDRNTRAYSFRAEVDTIYGTMTIEV